MAAVNESERRFFSVLVSVEFDRGYIEFCRQTSGPPAAGGPRCAEAPEGRFRALFQRNGRRSMCSL